MKPKSPGNEVSVDSSQKAHRLSQTMNYLSTERQLAKSKSKVTKGKPTGYYRRLVREAGIV
jgi:hypothetical protein